MVVKAKTASATDTISAPPGRAAAKLALVNAAPVSPDVQSPDVMMTSAVIVQTIIVSIKVPSIAM